MHEDESGFVASRQNDTLDNLFAIDILIGFNTSIVSFYERSNISIYPDNNVTNTSLMNHNWETWQAVCLGILLSSLCFVTAMGNAMVLYAVKTEKRLQTVSNMFIVSLAVSDLIVGAIVMPLSVAYILTIDWKFGIVVCQFWICVDYTASTASILNLFILSLDRYWSVRSPLQYIKKRTNSRARRMIAVVWLASSLWIIPVVGWHHFVNRGVRSVSSSVCDTEYANVSIFKVLTAILNFFLPLAVMYMLYGRIFFEIRKRSELEIGQKKTSVARDIGRNSIQRCTSVVEDSDNKNSTFGDETTPPLSTANNISRFISNSYNRIQLNDDICRHQVCHKISNSVSTDSHEKIKDNREFSVPKSHYVYDEIMLDPTTERIDRFVYTHRCLTIKPYARSETVYKPRNEVLNFYKSCDQVINNKHLHSNSIKYNLNNNIKTLENSLQNDQTVSVGKRTTLDISTRSVVRHIKGRVKFRGKGSQLSKEIKAARQLGVIMGAFTLCFMPYFILFLYIGFCEHCVEPNIMVTVTWIGYLNSTLNPCLYPLCNVHFRHKFCKMLCLKNSKADKVLQSERSTRPVPR